MVWGRQHARWAATGLLVVAIAIAPCYGGTTGQIFGPQARQMQMTFTGGTTGAEIIRALVESEWNIGVLQNICTDTPRLCNYASFLTGSVAMGVVVIPIFGVISCFAFCCARCSRNKCRCCCRACGQPNCFGRYPMREYKWFESLPTLLLLLLSITIVLAFCLGGMLAVYEIGDDLDAVVEGLSGIVTIPGDLLSRTRTTIWEVRNEAERTFNDANALLGGVEDVDTKVRVFEGELRELETRIKQLMFVVEGCWPLDRRTGTTIVGMACNGEYATNRLVHTPDLDVRFSYRHDRCTVMSKVNVGFSVFGFQENTRVPYENYTLGGYGLNPAGAICCVKCTGLLVPVLESLERLPLAQVFGDINKPFPVTQLRGMIDDSVGGYDSMFEGIEEPLATFDDSVKAAKASIPPPTFMAIGGLIFAPIIFFCVFIMLGMAMGGIKTTGKVGACCLWTGYFIGSLVFITLICPFWGIFTLTTLPLGDLCVLLPTPGVVTTDFRNTLDLQPPEGLGPLFWKTILDDCLLNEDGYMWPAMGLTRESLSDKLSDFDVTRTIPASSLNMAQKTDLYMRGLKGNLTVGAFTTESIMQGVLGQFCGTGTDPGTAAASCPSGGNWTAYYAEVLTQATGIQQQAMVVKATMNVAEAASANMTKNFTALFAASGNQLANIIDSVYDIGSCTGIAEGWEGLRAPLCDGVVGDLQAAWGGLFMCMIWVFFALLFTCHSAKVLFQAREGRFMEPELYEQMEDGNKVMSVDAADVHERGKEAEKDPMAGHRPPVYQPEQAFIVPETIGSSEAPPPSRGWDGRSKSSEVPND